MAGEKSARTLWGNENSNGINFFYRSRHPTLYELLTEIENHSHRNIEHRVSLLIAVWTCIAGKAHRFQNVGSIFDFIYRESALTVFSGLWARVSLTYKRGLARALTQCSQMMEKLVEGSAGLCSALVMNVYDPWGDPGLRHLFEDEVVNQKIVNDYVESEPQQLMLIRIECLVKANLDKAAVHLCQWCLKFRHGKTSDTNDHDSLNQDSWRWPFLEWLMRLLFRRGQLNDLVAESASCSCHDGVRLIHRVWCLSEAESEALTETLINLFLIRDLLFPSHYCCTKDKALACSSDIEWTIIKISTVERQILRWMEKIDSTLKDVSVVVTNLAAGSASGSGAMVEDDSFFATLPLKTQEEVQNWEQYIGSTANFNKAELMKLWCNFQVQKQRSASEVQDAARKLLVIHASTSAHFYLFVDILWEQYGISLLPVYMEMYVRGLTSDLNYLEAARQAEAQESVMEMESHMATIYYKLSSLFHTINKEVSRECLLSAFSLEPTRERLELILNLSQQIIEDNARRNKRAKLSSRNSNQSKQAHIENKKESNKNKVLNSSKAPTSVPKTAVATRDIAIQVGEIYPLQFCRPCTRPSHKLLHSSNEKSDSKQLAAIKSKENSNAPIKSRDNADGESGRRDISNAKVESMETCNAEIRGKESSKTVAGSSEISKMVIEDENNPDSVISNKQTANIEIKMKENSQTCDTFEKSSKEINLSSDGKNDIQGSENKVVMDCNDVTEEDSKCVPQQCGNSTVVHGSKNNSAAQGSECNAITSNSKCSTVTSKGEGNTITSQSECTAVTLRSECNTVTSNALCNAVTGGSSKCGAIQECKSAILDSTVNCHEKELDATKITKENSEGVSSTQVGKSDIPSVPLISDVETKVSSDAFASCLQSKSNNLDDVPADLLVISKVEDASGPTEETCQSIGIKSGKKECSADTLSTNKMKDLNDSNSESCYMDTSSASKIENKNCIDSNCTSEPCCRSETDMNCANISDTNHNACVNISDTNHELNSSKNPEECDSTHPNSAVSCKDSSSADAQSSETADDKQNIVNSCTKIPATVSIPVKDSVDCSPGEHHFINGLETGVTSIIIAENKGNDEEGKVIISPKIPDTMTENRKDVENEIVNTTKIPDGNKICQDAVDKLMPCKDSSSDLDKMDVDINAKDPAQDVFPGVPESAESLVTLKESAGNVHSSDIVALSKMPVTKEISESNSSPNIGATSGENVITTKELPLVVDCLSKAAIGAQNLAGVRNPVQNDVENFVTIKEPSPNEDLSKAGPSSAKNLPGEVASVRELLPVVPKSIEMISAVNEPIRNIGPYPKAELRNVENAVTVVHSASKKYSCEGQAKSVDGFRSNNSLLAHLYLFPHVIIDSNLPDVPASLLRDFVTVIEGLRNKHLKCTGRWQEIKDICEDYLENVSVLRTMLLQASYYDSVVESEMESYSQTSCGRNRQFGSHQSNESIFRDFNADKTAVMKRFVNYPSTAQFQGFVNLSDIHHPRLPLDRLLCMDVLSSHLERPKGHRRHRNREKDPTRNFLRKLRHDVDYDREVFKKKRKKKRKEKRGKSHNVHGKKRHSTHKGERAKKKRRRLKKNKESKLDLASGEYFSDLSSTELMNLVNEHSHIFSQDGITNMHCIPNKRQHSSGALLGENQVVASEEASNSISANLKKKKKQVSFEKLKEKKSKLIKGHKHLKHSRSLAKLNELKLARKQSKKKMHGGIPTNRHKQLPFGNQQLEDKSAAEQEYPQVVQFSSVKQMQSVQIHQSSVTVDLSGVSGVNKEPQNPSFSKQPTTSSDIMQASAQRQLQRCNAEDLMKVQLLMSKQQQRQQQHPVTSVHDPVTFHKDRFQYVQQQSGEPSPASQQSVVKYVCSKMTSHMLSVAQASKCVVVPNSGTESLEFDKIAGTSLTGKATHSSSVPSVTLAAAIPTSQTEYSKQHVVIGVPKSSLSNLASEVVLSESRSSTPTCTIIPSDYQVSAVPIDLSTNAIAYNFKQQHSANAPQVTALTIPIAQNMQDGSGGKIFAGKLVIPLNNCTSVKHPVVAKGIGQIIEATTANIVNSSCSSNVAQSFPMPGVILVKGNGQSTQIVCAPQQQQNIAIRETRVQPAIRPITNRPGISSSRKNLQKVIIPRATRKVSPLVHKPCVTAVSRPKKPVTASCILRASTSNTPKVSLGTFHANDPNVITSPSVSTQGQASNSAQIASSSSLTTPSVEETASSFGTVISIPASPSVLPVIESSTSVSLDGNMSPEIHNVTSVVTPVVTTSASLSTSSHSVSTTVVSSTDTPSDPPISESTVEKPDEVVLEARDEIQVAVASNSQEDEVTALTSPLSVADADSEIQEKTTESIQQTNHDEQFVNSPALCEKIVTEQDANADSEHEVENIPSVVQPPSEAEEEKTAASCSLAENDVEQPVPDSVSLPVKKNIASVTRVSHSQCEKQLQPLVRGGIQPTVRAPGVINTQVKVDGTTHSIEVPTRSLTSISEAVRFSLMDMDDATDTVENHVLQSFQTFSQDASSYVNQVSVTFGEGGSIASSLTATQTTATDLSSGQSSQAFQASLRRSQSETFSDCHTTVSSTTEWSPNASTSAVGTSQTCGRSLSLHHETDSASESKEDEIPKKKRKKRVKTDKATALELAQKFWCQICDRGFFSAYNLRRHCRNVHKMEFPKGSSDLPFNSPPSLCHAHIPGSCSSTEASPPNTTFAAGQQSVVSPKSPEFHLQSPCRDGKNPEFVLQASPPLSHGHIPQAGQLSNVNISQDFIIQSPPRISSQKTPQTSPVTPPKEYHIQSALNVSPGQASQSSKISPNSKATQDFSVQSSPCRAGQVHQTQQKILQNPMALHSAQCQSTRQLQQGRQIQKSVQSSGIVAVPMQSACQTQRSQMTSHCEHVQKSKQLNPPLRTDHVQQIVQIPQAHHAVQIQQTGQVHQIKKCTLNQHVSPAGQIHLQQVGQLAQIQQSGKGQVQKLIEVRQTTHGPSQDIVIQSARNIATGTVAVQGSTAIATAEFFHNQSSNSHQSSANHHSLTQQALASYAAAQLSNASRANIFAQNIQQANPERITCTHSTFANQNVGEFNTVGNQTYPVSRLSSEASDGLEDLEQFLLENMPWSAEQNTSQNSAHHSSNRPSSADSLTLTIPPQVPHGISLQQKGDSSLSKNKATYSKPKFKRLPSSTISKNSQTSKGSSVKKKAPIKKKSIHLGLSQARKECLVPPKIIMDPHKLSPAEASNFVGTQVAKNLLSPCFTENDSHSSDSVQCIKITHNPLKSGPSDSAISFSAVQNLVSVGNEENASSSILEEKNSLPREETGIDNSCKILPPVADFPGGLGEPEEPSAVVSDVAVLSLKSQPVESLPCTVQENCESSRVHVDHEAEALNSSVENHTAPQNVLSSQSVENSENQCIRDELDDLITKTPGSETYSPLILESSGNIISNEKATLPTGEKEVLISIPSHEFSVSNSEITENSSGSVLHMNVEQTKPETMLQMEHCTFADDCQDTKSGNVQSSDCKDEEGAAIVSEAPLPDSMVCDSSSFVTKVDVSENTAVRNPGDHIFLGTEVSEEVGEEETKVVLEQSDNSFKNETSCSLQAEGGENREPDSFQHGVQVVHDLGIGEPNGVQVDRTNILEEKQLNPVLPEVEMECRNLMDQTENVCCQGQIDESCVGKSDPDCVSINQVITTVDCVMEQTEEPFSTINQEALGIIFDRKKEVIPSEARQGKLNCSDGALCSSADGNLNTLTGVSDDLSANKGLCFSAESTCESKVNLASHYVDSSESVSVAQEHVTASQDVLSAIVSKTDVSVNKDAEDCACDTPEESEATDSLVPRGRSRLRDSKTTSIKRSCPCCDDQTCPPKKCRANNETGFGTGALAGTRTAKVPGSGRTLNSNRGKMAAVFKSKNVNGPAKNVHTRSAYQRPRTRSSAVTDSTNN